MVKHWGQLTAVLAVIGGGVLLATTPAQAKAGYTITKVQSIRRTAYHVKNDKKTLFTWDKTHTKRLWILNQLDSADQTMSWMADQKVTITHNGKSATYLHIGDEYNSDDGYVYAKSMVKGYSKGYQTDAAYFGYYRLDAATKVGVSPSGSVTLPKGTVVQTAYSAYNGHESLTINGDALSYQLRQKLGLTGTKRLKAVDLNAIKVTPVAQPAYNTVKHNSFADTHASNLFAGKPNAGTQKQLFRTTSDGYVEYYDNGATQTQSEAVPQGKPASQKILQSSTSHGVTTVAYRTHIKGLKDTPTTVAGKAGYQLTIAPQTKTTTVKDKVYDTYLIGGQPFFTYEAAATSPVTAKKVSAKTLASLDKATKAPTYYRTTKKVTVSAPFDAYVSGMLKSKITLPKGTIVAGTLSTQRTKGKTTKVLDLATSRLSANLLKPGYQRGLWAGQETATTKSTAAFTRVKRPAYLPRYGSAGDLYLGSTTKALLAGGIAKQSVQLTTNGYVEVRQNAVTGRDTEYRAQPKTSVKIQRTTIKGHTRYLYLAKKLSGFKTTKVKSHGKTQYRLALVNPQKTYAVDSDPEGDEDSSLSYYGFLTLGGKTFYTSYSLDN
ncbi:hypothetical protein [Levilactobacillus zymae]|uniref:Uncharacterized protein n=1 Tax=Levilactobacillus zymae TaxID=267363 RepID=A0A1Y6JVF1_9LACO|nr:hypothetical protein [Levilactobacillus zymae]SMS13102.1 hypothetical protein LZ3411_0052 [Levilactobacillus zymae]